LCLFHESAVTLLKQGAENNQTFLGLKAVI